MNIEIVNIFRKKTILITGASGMIGRNIIKFLTKINSTYHTDIKIIAHVRNKEKAERVFKNILYRKEFQLVVSDITELEIQQKVDYVIHTAGVTGGSKQHLEFPMKTINTALMGTKKVLDCALENHIKGMVFLSSLEVYGDTGMNEKYIYETDGGYIDITNPRSSYSESKRMCECMCASYTKQYGVPIYIARLTASFGECVSYNDKRVFSEFAKCIIDKRDIVLKSTGETIRNYCDAEDVAIACMVLLAKGEAGQAYNVANMDTEISIKDLAEKFIYLYPESESNIIFDLSIDEKKLGYNGVMRNVLNSEKLMKLGWKPVNTLDSTIKKLVQNMKNEKLEEEI